jgi:hypothetical protein
MEKFYLEDKLMDAVIPTSFLSCMIDPETNSLWMYPQIESWECNLDGLLNFVVNMSLIYLFSCIVVTGHDSLIKLKRK